MDEILSGFIEFTAWEMNKPKAYGPFHLIFTFVGLAVCVLAAYALRRLGKKGNRILLVSIGAFLILTEIYKQLFYYYHIGGGSYQWWIFPFQMCSIPMYMCLIVPFLKEGKVQRGMYGFMSTFNLLGGIMAFIEPSGIVHDHLMLTLHAFIWHMTLIFIGLYLIFSDKCANTRSDFKYSVITFVILCCTAFIINVSLWKVSGGTVNMFFVGPAKSSLAVFSIFAEKVGWWFSTLLYIPVVCLAAYIIFKVTTLIKHRLNARIVASRT